MSALEELVAALLSSLAIVGTAALHIFLWLWILMCAMLIVALLRWCAVVAWKAGVAAYRRRP